MLSLLVSVVAPNSSRQKGCASYRSFQQRRSRGRKRNPPFLSPSARCQPPSFAVTVHSSPVCNPTRSSPPKPPSRLETRTVAQCRTIIQSTGLDGRPYPQDSTPRTTDLRSCPTGESLVSKRTMLAADNARFLTRIAEPPWKPHQHLKAGSAVWLQIWTPFPRTITFKDHLKKQGEAGGTRRRSGQGIPPLRA